MNIRLFIAIALPEVIKEKIRTLLQELRPAFRGNRDLRWVTEDNWHFTVSFLGYQPETVLSQIQKSMSALPPLLKNEDKIKIAFEKLVYGPNDRSGNMRRMIWLTGDKTTSETIGRLKNILEENLKLNGVKWSREDYGDYRAHLTLARFSPVSLNSLPKIDERLDWTYEARGIDLMQSHLRRTGAVYEKLFGVDF